VNLTEISIQARKQKSTVREGSKVKTKTRKVRWDAARSVITITEGKRETEYSVEEYPADFGRAYAVVKLGAAGEAVEHYDANVDPQHEGCSCVCGLIGRQRCRHVAALLALKAAGQIN
jgi:hypothetical protein